MNNTSDSQKRHTGLWWQILLGMLLILLAATAVLIVNIDAIARSQINKALNRYLPH